MAVTHTPGPWKIAEPSNPDIRQIEDRLIYVEVDNERLHIAEVYQYQNDNNRDANGTALANATLIMAAPELLEALTALGVMPDGYCFCNQNRDPLKAEKEHTGECQDARATIAKAEPS